MAENQLVSMYSHIREPRLVAASFRVKYRDIFHMRNLYKLIHEWIRDREWQPLTDHEDFYGQKTDPDKKTELWIWWEINKKSNAKSYYKYKIRMNWHVVALEPKEIMHEGKKLKADTGEVEIKIRAWIEFNEKGWRDNWFLKHFPEVFRLRIFESNLDDHKRELYREVYNLQGTIKRYLNMKGFLPELDLEPFHPSYSWPN